jgi:hypothetical protein
LLAFVTRGVETILQVIQKTVLLIVVTLMSSSRKFHKQSRVLKSRFLRLKTVNTVVKVSQAIFEYIEVDYNLTGGYSVIGSASMRSIL